MLGKFKASIMAYLRSWFVVSPHPEQDPKKIKEGVEFSVGVVLAFVFGVVIMPVIWMWLGWLVCWGIILHAIQASVDQINQFPKKTRMLGVFLLMVAFIGVFAPIAYGQWREEKAASMEGDLLGGREGIIPADGVTRMIPILNIGDSQKPSGLLMMPNEQVFPYFHFFPDMQLKLEPGKKGPIVSTTVRQRDGAKVVEIDRNHWRIFPPYCSDKNFTDRKLEVLDNSGHVVLQLQIIPERMTVQINGEWWDDEGHGRRVTAAPGGSGGALIIPLFPNAQHNESLINPIFRYPSSEHWAELDN